MNIYDMSNDNTPLVISRDNILEESFNQFMRTNELDLKRRMNIFFVDEVAQNVGGVYKGMIQLSIQGDLLSET